MFGRIKRALRDARLAGVLLGALLGAMAASPARAAFVAIDDGAALSLSTTEVDLGCADLVVHGSVALDSARVTGTDRVTIFPTGAIAGGAGHLELSGNWNDLGSFTPGTSSVAFVDGCGAASAIVAGGSTFFDLSLHSTTGRSILLQSSATTSVINRFDARGEAGALLVLRSSSGNDGAPLALGQTGSADFIEVVNVQATVAPVYTGLDSVIGPDATGFFAGLSVPTLPGAFGAALALGLAASSRRRHT